jgi:hypothetical protein
MLFLELVRAIHEDRIREIEAEVRHRSLVAVLAERQAQERRVGGLSDRRAGSPGRTVSSSLTAATTCNAPPVPGQLG